MLKKLIRIGVVIILLPVLYLAAVILFGTITDFKPAEIEKISKLEDTFTIPHQTTFSAVIWNIGYAGLGANMDFFYDGGKTVRDSEDNTRANFYRINQWLNIVDTIDFILLQEIDVNSKRSYHINQVEELNLTMGEHFPFYAANYQVKFVPVPFLEPMGKVNSGLMTMTKHVPQQTDRYAYPGSYPWPKSVFMLDRCILVNRFLLDSGKEFILINTHNEAYDDGSIRTEQMKFLKEFLLAEEAKGNYVLVGGDWNQCPPEFKDQFSGHVFDTANLTYVPDDYLPENWQWVYDNTKPTNRRVITAYEKGVCPVTLIDFYLASSNIEILSCKTVNMDFMFSDHHPVIVKFRFK